MNILGHVAECAVILSVVFGQGPGGIARAPAAAEAAPRVSPGFPLPAGISGSGAAIEELTQLPAEPETPLGKWECWTPMQTVPCNHNLFAVDALSETDAWGAGEAGTFMHWDGIAWQPVPSPTLANLDAIDMLSSTDGWATGSGVILHWDGRAWANANATPYWPYGIALASSRDGWASDGASSTGMADPGPECSAPPPGVSTLWR